jgi:hypothetical protein
MKQPVTYLLQTARVWLVPWQQIPQRPNEATCHLLAANTWLQLPLHQDTSLGVMKGQMLKCQRSSGVYHLLHVCHVYIGVRVKLSKQILSVHWPSLPHGNLTTDQVTKWVKLPKWSGCLDLSKMPDATVSCIRSMYSQFQAENIDLPDLYTQQHRHYIIKISTRHETTAYDWFKLCTKRFTGLEHPKTGHTLPRDHPGSLQPEQSHSVLSLSHT